jgi:pullulanase/glycogen debranching enzyme
LVKDKLGLFQKPEHAVNYLESHDGYTLGDFIRLGLGDVKKDQEIQNVDEFVKLTPTQLNLSKLAALFLFTSRGITMIHSGQEFARTKIVASDVNVNDKHTGMIDHNSYEKDNETNYINYNHPEINKDLLDYYKGLIELRKTYKTFRRAKYEDVTFEKIKNKPFALNYSLKFDGEIFRVIFNANPRSSLNINLNPGEWEILVDENSAGVIPIKTISETVVISPSSGMVLKKR